MSIKIKEVIERNCCQPQDLKPYKGKIHESLRWTESVRNLKFCIHCGQVWLITSIDDKSDLPCLVTSPKIYD